MKLTRTTTSKPVQSGDGFTYYSPPTEGAAPPVPPPSRVIEVGQIGHEFSAIDYEPNWNYGSSYRWRTPVSFGPTDLGPVTWDESDGSLTSDAQGRTEYPMADGLLDYFPNALAEVARLSHVATQQHHPGEPMHWARGKSTDHRNKIMRHLVDTGKLDDKGMRHSAMVAWRALALLQEELEANGAPLSRASRLPTGDE